MDRWVVEMGGAGGKCGRDVTEHRTVELIFARIWREYMSG